MVYHRFVQIGRVAMVNKGPEVGKLCVIVDVLDEKNVYVDGTSTGVARKVIGLKNLQLTDYVIKISKGARTKTVTKEFVAADVNAKWEKTAWFKKLAQRKRRSELTDFERFQVQALRQKRSKA
eukprot:Awhi_evm3s6146